MLYSLSKTILVVFLVGLLDDFKVEAQFSNGATAASCVSLSESEFTPQPANTNPYTLTVSPTSYRPGDVIEVTLQSTQQTFFVAIICQARSSSGGTFPVGSFDISNLPDYQSVTCFDASTQQVSTTGTITNVDSTNKPLPVTFLWTAPDTNVGDVVFFATVVQSNNIINTFWEAIQSETLTVSLCPADITVVANTGGNFQVVTWNLPLPANTQIVLGPPNASGFYAVGQTSTVNYEFLNTQTSVRSSCSFDITVAQTGTVNNSPVITSCPAVGTITVNQVGTTQRQFFYTPPTCNDAEDGVRTVTCTPAVGTTVSTATNSITCSCSDTQGVPASCTTSNIVSVNSSPVITNCPAVGTITVNQVGTTQRRFFYTPPTCNDAEDGARTVTCTPAVGTTVSTATNSITCSCSDTQGVPASCTTSNIVSVNSSPVITSCPAVGTITVNQVGTTQRRFFYTPPTCNDAEDGARTVTCTPAVGTTVSTATNSITCSCSDTQGIPASCTTSNIVTVNSSPVITSCPAVGTITVVPVGTTERRFFYTPPTCNDAEDGARTVTCTPAVGTTVSTATNSITCSCSDTQGVPASCTTNNIVTVNSSPVITSCPAVGTITVVPVGTTQRRFFYTPPTCNDAEDGVRTVTCTPAVGTTVSTATNSITCSCSDTQGVPASCTTSNIVTVNSSPVITSCPAAGIITVVPVGTTQRRFFYTPPTCNDAEDGVRTVTCTPAVGTTVSTATNSITCSCSDTQGVPASCNTNNIVTVNSNPVITSCPAVGTITVNQVGTTQRQFFYTPPTCNDAEDGVRTVTCTPAVGTVVSTAINSITCSCSDTQGVPASCTTNNIATNIPPLVSCPNDVAEFSLVNNVGNFVSWADAICSDAEDAPGSITAVCDRQSGSFFQGLGATTVSCTCTDSAGDSNTCTFDVNVLAFVPTNIPPVATCPNDVAEFSLVNDVGNFVSWADAICTDAEDAPGSITAVCDRQSGSFFQGLGVTTVSCTCTDSAGDSNTCTFDVNVLAFVSTNIPPLVSCPNDVVEFSLVNNVGNFVSWADAICSDAEDAPGSITAVCDSQSGSFFQGLGVTTVSCTCTDSAGDSNTCTFDVNVLAFVPPNIPPVATCPNDVAEFSLVNDVGNFVSWADAICSDAEDAPGSITAVCDTQSGSFFQGLGVTTVSCTCTDSAGDSNTCTFDVNVLAFVPPNIPPVATCPNDVAEFSLVNDVGNFVSWADAICTDAEDAPGSITAVCDSQSGSFFQGLGVTTVSCTCTDSAGDSNTCTFDVNVLAFVPPNIPPVATCPNDVAEFSLVNDVGNFVSWADAICSDAEDAPGSITGVCDRQSGSFFQGLGVTTVSCTCTDSAGDSNTCTFDVNVLAFVPPNIPPTITCPADVSIKVNVGASGTVVTFNNPVCVDPDQNNQNLAISCNPSSNSFFQVGPTQVTCTCTDLEGATDTCSFTTNAFENTPPTITCSAPVTVISLAGNIGNTVTYNAPQCFDVEDNQGQLQTSCSQPSGSFFQGVGPTTVTCTCTDSCQDTDSCSFVVNINAPNIPPTITCPADISVKVNVGAVGTLVTFNNAVCIDPDQNNQNLAVSCNPSSNSFLQVGSNTVTCTCSDLSGVSDTCSFTATVFENTPPTITCPDPVTVISLAGGIGNTVTYNIPQCFDVEDNQGQLQTSCSQPSGSFFQDVGATPVTCTCTDSCQDTDSCTFLVNIVAPNIPPTITCPVDIRVKVNVGAPGTPVNFNNPVCVDPDQNNQNLVVSCTPTSNSFLQVGSSSVTCTCTDLDGAIDTCSFTATVFENNPPTVACPDPVTVISLAGSIGNTVTYNIPQCFDVEDNQGQLQTSCSQPSGSFFQGVGATTVTCTCTDSCQDTDTCGFVVNIVAPNIPPTITCPVDISVKVNVGAPGTPVNFNNPVCVDPDQNNQNLVVSCTPSANSFLQVGSSSVTCTCTDLDGAIDTCSFTATVFENNPPTVACPDPVTVISLAGSIGNTVTYNIPQCFDVEDNQGQLQTSCSQPSGSFFQGVGATTVTCTCTDSCQDTDTCGFVVNIVAPNIPPTITCPVDIRVKVNVGAPGTPVNFNNPVCVDPDQNNQNLVVSCTPSSNSFLQVGSSSVTCTCTDLDGAIDTCSFTATVFENNPPTVACPDPVTVISLAGSIGNTVTYNIPQCFDVEDNQGQLQTSCSQPSGSFFQGVGATTVTCTCTDSCQDTDTCSFVVNIVAPNIPPTITCPVDISVKVNVGAPGTPVNFNNPVCVDPDQNNQNLVVSCTPSSNSFLQVGSSSVTCTCTDLTGATDTCSFTATVFENNPPTITCPNPVTVTSLAGSIGNTVTYNAPQCFDVEDNQGQLQTSCSQPSGTFFQGVGPMTVTCTCTDSCQDTDSCTFIVNIEVPNVPPTITCPADITTNVNLGVPGDVVSFESPGCVDPDGNNQNLAISCSPSSNSFYLVGSNDVTCTCTDIAGDTDTCSFSVIVIAIDVTPPTIRGCPADITQIVEFGVPGTVVTWVEPTAVDNAGTASIVSRSHIPGSFFTEEETTVVYIFQDGAGNTATCEFCVNLVFAQDNIPPVVTCTNDVTVQVLRGNEGAIVEFQQPFATDNSGNVFLFNDPQWYSGFYFPIGVTPVLYTYSDDAGNTASCTFLVTVIEVSPCDSNPCQNAGVCFATSQTDFTCVCSGCFQGTVCEISIPNPCNLANNCQNGGVCQLYQGSCTQTFCECQQCTRGDLCEILVNPCDDSPCQNGAQCVPDPDDCCAYTCQCVGCFTGPLCADLFSPCSPNPCANEGVCAQTPGSCLDFTCQCQGCFEGFNCQNAILDPCLFSPCLNGGRCTRAPGSCTSFTCDCLDEFAGPLCQDRVLQQKNPCLAFPCENDGCCVSLSNNNYKCLCRDGYAGVDCENLITSPLIIASCDSSPCQNGATCYNSYSSDSPDQFYIPQYTCACPSGFSGSNCAISTVENALLDTCRQSGRICLNQGTCQNTFCSFNQNMGTFCNCRDGFYGENCEFIANNPCFPSPCRNGGQCMSFTKYFVCQCVPGFSGITCEVGSVDIVPPTFINCPQDVTVSASGGNDFGMVNWPQLIVTDNSGVVELVRSTGLPGSYPVGTRPIQYQYRDPAGNIATCDFQITVLPAAASCNNNPCQNGGTCFDVPSGFICNCAPGFIGTTCATVQPTGCSASPCQNGGTCVPTSNGGFTCLCVAGFSGNMCQQVVTAVCSPNPCLNGGNCNVAPGTLLGYFCQCTSEFTGQNCQAMLVNLQSLPQGVFASPGFGSSYPEGVDLSWIIRGTAPLQTLLLALDLRPGDILRYGDGSMIGDNEIDTFDGEILGGVDMRTASLSMTSLWITFTTNNDGNTGMGFALQVTEAGTAGRKKKRSLRSNKNETRVSQTIDRSTAVADIFLGN